MKVDAIEAAAGDDVAVGIGTATDLFALLNGVLWTVSCWWATGRLDELSESAAAFSVSLSFDLFDPVWLTWNGIDPLLALLLRPYL